MCTSYKVAMSSCTAVLTQSDTFRADLTSEVDAHRGVDGHDVVVDTDVVRIIHPAGRSHLHALVVIQEVIGRFLTLAEAKDGFAGQKFLP